MNVVNVDAIQKIKFLNSGTYSTVDLVCFGGKTYCYKQFKYPFSDPKTISRLAKLTEKVFPKEFLVPLHMVEGTRMLGYLCDYDEKLLEIEDCFTREEKISLLRSAKNLLNILHKDLKYIHGDIHTGNILCDKESLSTYFLDFDFSFKVGKIPNITDDFTEVLQDYLKKYRYDENVDIYLFNLMTLHVLKNEYDWNEDLLFAIYDESYNIPEMNKDIKRLSKELLLNDTRKPYSGEYIVDYIK